MDIFPPSSPPEAQAASNADQWANLFEGVSQFVIKISQALAAGAQVVMREKEKVERENRRAQLLEAYRTRTRWKKSDIKSLASLNVNEAAKKRIARLSGTGRPVVKPHEQFWERLARNVIATRVLFSKSGTPQERRKAFWEWPWHEYYIEALYRGEHARAKAQKRRDAARFAEAEIADALGISSSKVHKICGEIRNIAEKEERLSPATITQFDTWMRTGERVKF